MSVSSLTVLYRFVLLFVKKKKDKLNGQYKESRPISYLYQIIREGNTTAVGMETDL